MSSTHPRDNRRGFTLTEMLVVIGIIVLVLSIATPMITRAWKAGDRARMQADLAAIGSALEAYKQDHGDYPQVNRPWTAGPVDFNGARMLCRALIAPGPEVPTTGTNYDNQDIADGKGADLNPPDPRKPGPGFRTRVGGGKVYGPYLPIERFKLGDPSGTNTAPGYLAILDKYNHPILYYPAVGKPNIRMARSYAWDRAASDKPMYNARDNWSGTAGAMPKEVMARMLGDFNANGMIDAAATPAEVPAYEGPYLLWAAGPDETFGTPAGMPVNSVEAVRKAVERSDDITNFRQ